MTVLSMSIVPALQQADAESVVNNLRIGSSSFDGILGVFAVGEENQEIDLNGDGDKDDRILHVYDHSTGKTTNLRLAGSVSGVDGNLVGIVVDERAQGDIDLNNDGDNNSSVEGVFDFVLHIYDHSTGEITNLRLAAEFVSLDGNLVAFVVSERAQGDIDLNNDGDNGNPYDEDAEDSILHVYDHSTGETTNLEIVSDPPILDGNIVVFTVNEANQGDQDLDEGNSSPDDVLHTYDHSTGEITNLRLAGFLLYDGNSDGNLVQFIAYENDKVDLNGDGDTDDLEILHIYDLSTGVFTNLGLIISESNSPLIDDNLIILQVDERAQGKTDLNGDGDIRDSILHTYDISTGKITNLELEGSPRIDDNLIVFWVFEKNHGNTDLNGDGDTDDNILHIYDRSTGETNNLELATGFTGGFKFSFSTLRVNDNLVIFHVHEDDQGNTDLNGDGDTDDRVLHVYDHFTGKITNLELIVDASILDGNLVTFSLPEFDRGLDLNGDGDTDDNILHTYDPLNEVITDLGLVGDIGAIDNDILVIFVSEFSQGNTDLNGDGDHDDKIAHVYDRITGEITNLKLDSSFPIFSDNNLLGFLISEYSQGNTDFNGDGDANDFVLHLVDLTEDELFWGQPSSSYDSIIEGTSNDDLLEGTKDNDLIFGMDDNDLIFASNGNDCVYGGDGNDSIFGRGGNDIIFGDSGNDTIFGAPWEMIFLVVV